MTRKAAKPNTQMDMRDEWLRGLRAWAAANENVREVGIFYVGQLATNAQDHSVKGNFTWRF
jgi:hypothetical protein